MTLQTDFVLTIRNNQEAFVTWTAANADDFSFVFVNGQLLSGNYAPGTAERTLIIPLPQDGTASIDIHDFEEDSDDYQPFSIDDRPWTLPLIRWKQSDGATKYRVYAQKYGESEELWREYTAVDGLDVYEVECPEELDGVGGNWYFFRIEAVNEYGEESTTNAFAYFAMDLPEVPGLTISGGSGTFTFMLTGV
jgi:hypothetical protein